MSWCSPSDFPRAIVQPCHPIAQRNSQSEYLAGHVAGADHVELGRLASRIGDISAGPLAVMCGHGERAMTAASLLERAGHDDLAVVVGGPEDWAQATGQALSRS